MKERIEQVLSVLIGLPLLDAGRAVDLEWFHFGHPRIVTTRKGGTTEVGDYALHIQCAWRVKAPNRIIVASRDRYYPPHDSEDIPAEFDWDVPHGNRCDARIEAFLQAHSALPLIVTSVEADEVGSVRLLLTKEYVIEVFPDDSFDSEYSEHWRFFQPSMGTEHFVVSGEGIREE